MSKYTWMQNKSRFSMYICKQKVTVFSYLKKNGLSKIIIDLFFPSWRLKISKLWQPAFHVDHRHRKPAGKGIKKPRFK